MTDKLPPTLIARIAGALYLDTIIGCVFAEVVSRGSLIVGSDAVATAKSMLGKQALFAKCGRANGRNRISAAAQENPSNDLSGHGCRLGAPFENSRL